MINKPDEEVKNIQIWDRIKTNKSEEEVKKLTNHKQKEHREKIHTI